MMDAAGGCAGAGAGKAGAASRDRRSVQTTRMYRPEPVGVPCTGCSTGPETSDAKSTAREARRGSSG